MYCDAVALRHMNDVRLKCWHLASGAMALVACAARMHTERIPTMTERTSVESRLAQAYADMAAGDVERLLDLYTQDAVIQSPGELPIEGTTAIRSFWKAMFDRYQVQLTPEVGEVAVFGDIVVVRGRAVGVLAPKHGDAALQVDTWFMQIYRRQADGSLRFWRGTNGPNPDQRRSL